MDGPAHFGNLEEARTLRERLREPFPPEQVGKLPKPLKRDSAKGKCPECGGWHGLPAIHLDYVGHAAVVDRLNRYAPDWTYTLDKLFDHDDRAFVLGTMIIGGVSRQEYGDGKDPKEAVSNFIRRAAMRFGVALDLWSKEELDSSVGADLLAASAGSSGAGEATGESGAPAPLASSEGVGVEEKAAPASSESLVLHLHGAWSSKQPDGKSMRPGWVRCTNLLPNGTVCGYAEKLHRVNDSDMLEVPA